MLNENENSLFAFQDDSPSGLAPSCEISNLKSQHQELMQQLENVLWDHSNSINSLKASKRQLEIETKKRERLEQELRLTQKLESIGKLAAGVAHEINTPMQFLNDNTGFLEQSFSDLLPIFDKVQELIKQNIEGNVSKACAEEIQSALEEVDIEYLMEDVPEAIKQSKDGIGRVRKIVQSMKEFSHPGSDTKDFIDLNHSIESTVTVATNEWKYVAEMQLDLDPGLPNVKCFPGEINQVILNMTVNAAHAISYAKEDKPNLNGKITISTKQQDKCVELKISDNGTGIPEEIKEQIFDPFFTTKEVGKGTGQGLAIAYNVIINKHSGTINIDSTPGEGTTFTIKIPIDNDSTEE